MRRPTQKCVECRSNEFRPVRRKKTWVFGDRKFIVAMPARECVRCGAVTFAIDVVQDAERAIARRLAQEGPVSGETFAYLRKVLRMKSGELAAGLGVAPETVSRWENGKGGVDRAAWLTVGTLALEALTPKSEPIPALRDRLDLLARPPKRKTVDLSL